MPEPTKAADPNTATEAGQNSEGAGAEGAGTQTAKLEDARSSACVHWDTLMLP